MVVCSEIGGSRRWGWSEPQDSVCGHGLDDQGHLFLGRSGHLTVSY